MSAEPDAPTGRRAAEVILEPMRRRHLRAVQRIEAHSPHRPWSLGLFMSELSAKTGRVYAVAKAGSSVVGFAGMLFSDTDAHVTTITVHPDWQHRQVGTRLMLLLARQARRWGMTALTLEVGVGNTAAIGLYRRFGLAPAGTRSNYYAETGEDALIMWAHDIDSEEYRSRLETIEGGLDGGLVAAGFASPDDGGRARG